MGRKEHVGIDHTKQMTRGEKVVLESEGLERIEENRGPSPVKAVPVEHDVYDQIPPVKGLEGSGFF